MTDIFETGRYASSDKVRDRPTELSIGTDAYGKFSISYRGPDTLSPDVLATAHRIRREEQTERRRQDFARVLHWGIVVVMAGVTTVLSLAAIDKATPERSRTNPVQTNPAPHTPVVPAQTYPK